MKNPEIDKESDELEVRVMSELDEDESEALSPSLTSSDSVKGSNLVFVNLLVANLRWKK